MGTTGRFGSAVVTLGIVALATACSSSGDKQLSNGRLGLKGTIHSVQASDGSQCWQLVSSSGKQYELQPAQAPASLLVDGAQADIVAKPRSGGSFCKVGQIIDVLSDTAANAKS